MLRSSSSTFSSEGVRSKRPESRARLRRHILSIVLWTIAALILIDAAVGFAFRPPLDPRRVPSSLQRYFDYGRSIEGKLRREVGSTPEQDAAIVKAGWLANDCDIATSTPPGKFTFDIYGMSFSNRIARQMVRLDPGLASQSFAGPAAPPNHSYACFVRRAEAKLNRAPIQIFGILASSVPRMETISGLTTSFEAPEPFTYPRYSLARDGRIVGYSPSINTPEDLRVVLANPAKWRAFLDELAAHDAFYAPRVFQADVFDYSVLTRMIRRAWGQRVLRDRTTALRAADGFSGAPDIAPVLRAMLIDFANRARTAGEHPIVILIEDQGYGGTLSAIAAPALQANHIDFVITSMIISPDDASNFLADGHFTPLANEKIAQAVLDLLGRTH
jgi:hypothetical protein